MLQEPCLIDQSYTATVLQVLPLHQHIGTLALARYCRPRTLQNISKNCILPTRIHPCRTRIPLAASCETRASCPALDFCFACPLRIRLPHRNRRSWRGEIRQTPITITVHYAHNVHGYGSPRSNLSCCEQVAQWEVKSATSCSTCPSRLVDDMSPSPQRSKFFFLRTKRHLYVSSICDWLHVTCASVGRRCNSNYKLNVRLRRGHLTNRATVSGYMHVYGCHVRRAGAKARAKANPAAPLGNTSREGNSRPLGISAERKGKTGPTPSTGCKYPTSYIHTTYLHAYLKCTRFIKEGTVRRTYIGRSLFCTRCQLSVLPKKKRKDKKLLRFSPFWSSW